MVTNGMVRGCRLQRTSVNARQPYPRPNATLERVQLPTTLYLSRAEAASSSSYGEDYRGARDAITVA